jgi:tetratricopeptide (TPR) repeat protein
MSRDANLSALKVDRPYYDACFPQRKKECLPVYTGHYYSHNLMFLAESYAFMGSSALALETARKAQQNALAFIEGQPELEHYVAALSVMQVGFQQWEDIQKESPPRTSLLAATALWRWARSYAYAKKGDLQRARDEQRAFFAAVQQVPYDLPYGNNRAQTLLSVASNLLRARIAAGEGQKDAAVELLQLAVDNSDALTYDEPPPWLFPVRDALGAAYYQAGRYKESATTFQKSLDLQPLNPRALYGLAQSQKAAGSQGWQDAQNAFEQAARDGDVQYSIDGLW